MSTLTAPTEPRLAFVQATWHHEIVDEAFVGFERTIDNSATVERYEVPGAFELPLYCRLLAMTRRFDAIIAAALVVDGGIYRHEYVAATVLDGLMHVQLETDVPIFSSVLTPQQFRVDGVVDRFFGQHMVDKGAEVATACLRTLEARARLAA